MNVCGIVELHCVHLVVFLRSCCALYNWNSTDIYLELQKLSQQLHRCNSKPQCKTSFYKPCSPPGIPSPETHRYSSTREQHSKRLLKIYH